MSLAVGRVHFGLQGGGVPAAYGPPLDWAAIIFGTDGAFTLDAEIILRSVVCNLKLGSPAATLG